VAGPFIGKYIKYVRDIHAYAKKTVRLREHLFRAHIPDSNKATPNMIPGGWGLGKGSRPPRKKSMHLRANFDKSQIKGMTVVSRKIAPGLLPREWGCPEI